MLTYRESITVQSDRIVGNEGGYVWSVGRRHLAVRELTSPISINSKSSSLSLQSLAGIQELDTSNSSIVQENLGTR
jgi:hypothetical protein